MVLGCRFYRFRLRFEVLIEINIVFTVIVRLVIGTLKGFVTRDIDSNDIAIEFSIKVENGNTLAIALNHLIKLALFGEVVSENCLILHF